MKRTRRGRCTKPTFLKSTLLLLKKKKTTQRQNNQKKKKNKPQQPGSIAIFADPILYRDGFAVLENKPARGHVDFVLEDFERGVARREGDMRDCEGAQLAMLRLRARGRGWKCHQSSGAELTNHTLLRRLGVGRPAENLTRRPRQGNNARVVEPDKGPALVLQQARDLEADALAVRIHPDVVAAVGEDGIQLDGVAWLRLHEARVSQEADVVESAGLEGADCGGLGYRDLYERGRKGVVS